MNEIFTSAEAWLAQDPDPVTAGELAETLAAARAGDPAASKELASAFGSRLEFGTAGLRGELGFGPSRMNRVLVAQAAAGFSKFLFTRSATPTLVIGYDGRHNSRVFAVDTAEIAAAAGITTLLIPSALPTPLLAYAVRHLGADGGVMVTASHNPAKDNGYKVYLGGPDHGAQIVPPTDGEIAALITQVAAGDIRNLPHSGNYSTVNEDVVSAYISACADARLTSSTAEVPFVYTAMHGVGYQVATTALAQAGFCDCHVVAQQRDPNPDFPTVPFPNPEEPGALDLSIALAKSTGAKVIIANDPDADRLAIGTEFDGKWQRLSGNQVGALLGEWSAKRAPAGATLAASLVSSPLLSRIAANYGLEYAETLTGFKYISRVPGLVFGYEEALGYLVNPDTVHDKDGISAAVAFMSIVAELAEHGQTVADALADLDKKYGAYASGQVSIRNSDPAMLAEMVQHIRDTKPMQLAGLKVAKWTDYKDGIGSWAPQNIVRADLDDGSRIIIRPSGTEPKVKMYVDVVAADHAAALAKLAKLQAGGEALLRS